MTDRLPLMAGNWKMNLNHLEAIQHTQKLAFALAEKDYEAVEVAVLVPFTDLRSVQTLVDGDKLKIKYGAQDLSAQDSGAYTGEISGPMLAKLKCTYVAIGHSERRQYHGEDEEIVNAKVKAAYRNGITPILCIGETLSEREDGQTEWRLQEQLAPVLEQGAAALDGAIIAYEPVWAIGTGKTATPEQAQEVHAFIRGEISQYDARIAGSLPILYGGSVKADNAAALFAQPDVDGGLVGGASLVAADFNAIVAAAA
jgi:triosephosphate isomerase